LGTPPKSAAHSRTIWGYCQHHKGLKIGLFEDNYVLFTWP